MKNTGNNPTLAFFGQCDIAEESDFTGKELKLFKRNQRKIEIHFLKYCADYGIDATLYDTNFYCYCYFGDPKPSSVNGEFTNRNTGKKLSFTVCSERSYYPKDVEKIEED